MLGPLGKWGLLLGTLTLAACGALPEQQQQAETPQVQTIAGWQHMPLPGKSQTIYRPMRLNGRDVLEVRAEASASLLRRRIEMTPDELGRLRFSWMVPQLMESADMARRDAEDAVVRVVLSFDGDRARLTARDHLLSELALLMTGEPMPYATLMYVWCPTRAPGSVIHNPRSDRIRKLVVESGPKRLNQWLDYERDIRADFRAAFGEDPGRLIGLALMTDSDNTRSQALAWYGPVELDPRARLRAD